MDPLTIIVLISLMICLFVFAGITISKAIKQKQYDQLTFEIQQELGIKRWLYLGVDSLVELKSSRAVDNYEPIQFLKDNRNRVAEVSRVLAQKKKYADMLTDFLKHNQYSERPMYEKVKKDIEQNLKRLNTYDVTIRYISPARRSTNSKLIHFDKGFIDNLQANPSLLMNKSEYNQYIKERNKELLDSKHHDYYNRVNRVIDLANDYRDKLLIKGNQDELDRLISSLFDRTVNSIKKIKEIDSDEWIVIGDFISSIEKNVNNLVSNNQRILDYYSSSDFIQIKSTCDSLMNSQRDFNEYIKEKVQSISNLFGIRIERNETVIEDEFDYIRPYKKSIAPFTAEVSSAVFASAENNPIEYVVKLFYPNKELYPEQIQKLQLLIEELETLKDARAIIENYKKEYQQYITNVPSFIFENDEDGFYSRLGFADVSESALTIEYRFSYTSNGGKAQRSFTVPMTEETIIELVNILQSKLTMSSFAKEQRTMMTSKLRQQIKQRDNFTCKYCGNSLYKEPNLLLEIDHIIPVAKGGYTVEDNLQTLCWKCNRSKSDKIVL